MVIELHMTENIIHSFTQNDYEIIKRDVLYQGVFLRLARYQLTFKLFDGEISPPVVRELLERQSAVGLLPYDPILDKVILIEQFRPGALANPQSPWLLEIVAGLIDAQEGPKDAALREAQEEAGCDILDLYSVCEYFVSPGGSNEYLQIFCGRVDTGKINLSQANSIFGLQKENENIRALILPVEEALDLVRAGHIKTAPAIISLQWLQLNREWLKQLWQAKAK